MSRCPRCNRPPNNTLKLDLAGLSVCSHCGAFLEPSNEGVGFRSLLPSDLEKLPEDVRWELLRARAEYRARNEQARLAQ